MVFSKPGVSRRGNITATAWNPSKELSAHYQGPGGSVQTPCDAAETTPQPKGPAGRKALLKIQQGSIWLCSRARPLTRHTRKAISQHQKTMRFLKFNGEFSPANCFMCCVFFFKKKSCCACHSMPSISKCVIADFLLSLAARFGGWFRAEPEDDRRQS